MGKAISGFLKAKHGCCINLIPADAFKIINYGVISRNPQQCQGMQRFTKNEQEQIIASLSIFDAHSCGVQVCDASKAIIED